MKIKIILLFLLMAVNAAAAPNLINYQGVLTDSTGAPVANATQAMTFRLYDAETAGTLLWEEGRTVDVQNCGLYRNVCAPGKICNNGLCL